MIICHCGVVNGDTVTRAVDAGARTLSQVCRSTGAGQDCGTCVFALRRLICEHGASPHATLPEVDSAAS